MQYTKAALAAHQSMYKVRKMVQQQQQQCVKRKKGKLDSIKCEKEGASSNSIRMEKLLTCAKRFNIVTVKLSPLSAFFCKDKPTLSVPDQSLLSFWPVSLYANNLKALEF